MSKNFYARIIPSKEKKEKLKSLIDNNDFERIEDVVNEMYGKPYFDGEKLTYGIVHLGKRSVGWKFLWNPNLFEKLNGYRDSTNGEWLKEPSDQITVYRKLDKEHIKSFINRDDVIIIDEYKKPIDKEEFWNMALNWCVDGLDMDKYYEEIQTNPHIMNSEQIKFIKELIQQGYDYKLSKFNSDFYSDGLLFSTTNEFS